MLFRSVESAKRSTSSRMSWRRAAGRRSLSGISSLSRTSLVGAEGSQVWENVDVDNARRRSVARYRMSHAAPVGKHIPTRQVRLSSGRLTGYPEPATRKLPISKQYRAGMSPLSHQESPKPSEARRNTKSLTEVSGWMWLMPP